MLQRGSAFVCIARVPSAFLFFSVVSQTVDGRYIASEYGNALLPVWGSVACQPGVRNDVAPCTPDFNVDFRASDWQYIFRYSRPRFLCPAILFNIEIGGTGGERNELMKIAYRIYWQYIFRQQ